MGYIPASFWYDRKLEENVLIPFQYKSRNTLTQTIITLRNHQCYVYHNCQPDEKCPRKQKQIGLLFERSTSGVFIIIF